MEGLGKRLQMLRKARGWSVREIAGQLGVPETTYREWEYGRAIQGEGPYQKLSELLSISIFELITGKRPNKRKILKEIQLLEKQVEAVKKEVMSFF